MKGPLALSLAAVVLLAVGCSHPAATNTPTAATSASSSPTPTSSPTATLLDRQHAQERYLVLVVPSNEAITAYNKAIKQRKSWRTLRTNERHLTTTVAQEAKAVAAVRWPADVQPAMNTWIAALIADAALLNRAAKATTEADFFAAAHKAEGKQSHAAEGKVIGALGL